MAIVCKSGRFYTDHFQGVHTWGSAKLKEKFQTVINSLEEPAVPQASEVLAGASTPSESDILSGKSVIIVIDHWYTALVYGMVNLCF